MSEGGLIRAVRGHDEEIAQRRSEELGATALLGSASGKGLLDYVLNA